MALTEAGPKSEVDLKKTTQGVSIAMIWENIDRVTMTLHYDATSYNAIIVS